MREKKEWLKWKHWNTKLLGSSIWWEINICKWMTKPDVKLMSLQRKKWTISNVKIYSETQKICWIPWFCSHEALPSVLWLAPTASDQNHVCDKNFEQTIFRLTLHRHCTDTALHRTEQHVCWQVIGAASSFSWGAPRSLEFRSSSKLTPEHPGAQSLGARQITDYQFTVLYLDPNSGEDSFL